MITSIKSPQGFYRFSIFNFQFPIFNPYVCLALVLFAHAPRLSAEDATWTYTDQVSATVQASPPEITLHWEGNDPYGVLHWSIYRKAKDETSWNFITTLEASITSWTDMSVSLGSTYE